jgi:tyrosyl-tRNA synthetase
MGKTAKGAVWLDPKKTTPFEFYQYWRNVDDADVANCLKLLTFLDLAEIAALTGQGGESLNEAKKRLAFEVTQIVHGQAAADEARQQAADLFEGAGRSEAMPTTTIERSRLAGGLDLLQVLLEARLIPSKGEGRRLVQQGGLYLNGSPVTDIGRQLAEGDFTTDSAIIRKGKKIYHRLLLAD